MKFQTRSIAAVLAATFSFALSPAHADPKVTVPEVESRSALTRAEVLADLALWRRAGLLLLSNREGFNTDRPEYAERLALYKKWRNGAEYVAELKRQRGEVTITAQVQTNEPAQSAR